MDPMLLRILASRFPMLLNVPRRDSSNVDYGIHDTVAGERFSLVDVEHGAVMAYVLYQPWTEATVWM